MVCLHIMVTEVQGVVPIATDSIAMVITICERDPNISRPVILAR